MEACRGDITQRSVRILLAGICLNCFICDNETLSDPKGCLESYISTLSKRCFPSTVNRDAICLTHVNFIPPSRLCLQYSLSLEREFDNYAPFEARVLSCDYIQLIYKSKESRYTYDSLDI